MSVRIATDGKLHGIDGWQGADCVELTGGLSNRSWKVVHGGRTAVLKIDTAPRSAPFNSRLAEQRIQSAAAAADLAPRVLYADEQVYLTEYLDGVVWQRADLDEPDNMERLAEALRRVHALPLTGRSFDAREALQYYLRQIEAPDQDVVRRCEAVVAAWHPPATLRCCHNDLVAENLISVPALRFLDWEYACDNDPLFDLATVIEHHQLKEEQTMYLLDTYFEGDGERWRERLAAQRQLYRVLLWLWLASGADTDRETLTAVGERITTSCS